MTLRNPQTNAELADQHLLIDTGADATLVAFDGTRSIASVADLDLIFLNRRFRGRYLLTDEDTGVLGRDILNHLALVFDGPGNQWTEHR